MTESKAVDLSVLDATIDDLEGVLKLQYLGYQVEAQRYEAYHLEALTQTLASLRQDLASTTMLVIRLPGGEIVGTVRGRRSGASVHVGRLVVHPRFQRQGLGSRLLSTLEQHYRAGTRFDVFTGHRSEEFLGLYQRAGYRRYREDPVDDRLTLVHLEKLTPSGQAGQPSLELSGQPGQERLTPQRRVPPGWT